LIYLDTSALVPFYLTEALSVSVEELFRQEPDLALSQLVEVELFSALSRRVRMREITSEDARSIVDRFQGDLEQGFYQRLVVEPRHYGLARDWIGQFATPLRTLDALHLAIAFTARIALATADEGLAASAEMLGVDVRILRSI
jgi:uncharacterized protein